jgi:hypothetical protein
MNVERGEGQTAEVGRGRRRRKTGCRRHEEGKQVKAGEVSNSPRKVTPSLPSRIMID